MNLFRPAAWVLLCLAAGTVAAQQPAQETRESGIVERAEGRLMQIDVSVRGPAEVVEALTTADFAVTVGREDIDEFLLDRVCIDRQAGALALDPGRPEAADPAVGAALRTLIYFDQVHLTSAGRQRALELARELIPQLLAGGRSEAMLVSAGRRLKVAAEWTSDPDVLIAALGELAEDPLQVMTWADEEEQRVEQLMTAIDRSIELGDETRRAALVEERRNTRDRMTQQSGLVTLDAGTRRDAIANLNDAGRIQLDALEQIESAQIIARVVARDLAKEEQGRTAGGLSMFAAALQHLDDFPPPKAVIYFSDIVRANPGDYLIGLVKAAQGESFGSGNSPGSGNNPGGGGRPAPPVRLSMGNYVHEFQDVIDLSTEKGVRLYTVQGRGLTPQVAVRSRSSSPRHGHNNPAEMKMRFKDAEAALGGLAAETGGESFLWAADASDIAGRILDDLSCLFVLSFRAIELKTDRSTAVFIDVDRPGVELQYRPRMIALSDEAREKARLASAFWSGDRDRDLTRIVVIPTGYDKGKYTALVQFAVPGDERAASDWDMGLTLVHGTSRAVKANGRVAVNQPGLPLVFEAEMKIKPGAYTITAVAQHRERNQVVSTRLDGSLPDPDEAPVPFVASTVLLQRVPGAFVRGEEAKTTGSLAHTRDHWLRPDRATALLALVCAGRDAEPVTVVRRLEGAGAVSFEPVPLAFDEERCGLLIDTVDAGTFTSGRFEYYVGTVGAGGGEIHQASTSEFLVVTPEEIAAARMEDAGERAQ